MPDRPSDHRPDRPSDRRRSLARFVPFLGWYRPGAQVWRYVKTIFGVIFRHPIIGATAVPLLANGQVVLVRRRDNGLWSLPGGLVDWGETVQQAIERELWEETSLRVVAFGRLAGVYSDPDRDPRIHSICIVVEVQVTGTMQVRDTLELLEVRAFDRNDLPVTLAHDHARQLQDFFSGRSTLA